MKTTLKSEKLKLVRQKNISLLVGSPDFIKEQRELSRMKGILDLNISP